MEEKQKRKVKGALIVVFTIIALLAFWMPEPGLSSANASKTMPGKMVLDDPEAKTSPYSGDKGKTPFDHDQHVAKDSCVVCHHTNSKTLTKAVEEDVLKCSECHKGEETTNELEGTNEDKKFKGLAAISAEEAFHGKGSLIGCIGCHKERDIPPTGCNECHNGG